ncbi:hypothetical protein [Methylobacter sp. sgz302048]|uniref:hypothetical protein n=1 Tax=Methylobacter sp. sgz302048 TaxID=3455945 RepID=UPI003F9EFEE3
MNLNCKLIGLLYLFITISATAAEREFQSVAQFLDTLSPAPIWQVVEGDLDGDGFDDRAIVTHQPNSEVLPKLYVLLQNRSGSFRLAQESQTAGYHNGAVELAIKNGSLYITLEAIESTTQGTHQFKLYRGEWRLIGMTHSTYDSADLGPEHGAHFLNLDFNVLTGDIISKRESKKGERITRDKAIVKPCLLENYNFDFYFCIADWKMRKGVPVSVYMVPN